MRMVTAQDFFTGWKHSLADDFQQNGVPAASEPWVSELGRILVNSDKTSVVALSHDNTLVAAVVGREICVYDLATAKLLHTLRGHTGYIRTLEFHPGGRLLASGSSINGRDTETLVRVWDLEVPEHNTADLEHAAKAAASAAAPVLLQHWSAEDLQAAKLQAHITEIIFAAQTMVDVRNGRAFLGELPHFEARAFSRDGRSLLYLPNRTNVAVLDVNTLSELFRFSGHTDAIVWAETSPDDKVVATSSWDRTVRIWSMESGAPLQVLTGERNQSWAGAFSPDSTLVAAGAGDQMVRVWRVATGELVHTLSGFRGWVRTLAFSPDGLRLAAGAAGGTLRVFNVDSGDSEQHWQIEGDGSGFLEVLNVQYTSRGDLFFSSTGGRIFGYRASKNLKWDFFDWRGAGSVVTSVDGSKLIAALGSNIGIWKIESSVWPLYFQSFACSKTRIPTTKYVLANYYCHMNSRIDSSIAMANLQVCN